MNEKILHDTLKAIADNVENVNKIMPISEDQADLQNIISKNVTTASSDVNFYITHSIVIPIYISNPSHEK